MLLSPRKATLGLAVIACFAWSFLAGCAHKLSLSSQYVILPDKPDGVSLCKNVMLVADNQLNHLYGDPIWLRTGLTDKLVKVAIRPVQQDIFGQDLLRWSLGVIGKRRPVIHLGDGTNMACRGEFESFIEIMAASDSWFMAPGNHDAYFFGNMHFNLGEWKRACERADGPMTKDQLVQTYLEHLQQQHQNFRIAYPGGLPASGHWRAVEGDDILLRSVGWAIDEKQPWRSYVAQELNLSLPNSAPPVYTILLDTTQYAAAPTLVPTPISSNAGINGDMQPDQLEVVRQWLEDDPTKEKITILMGHHPSDRFLKKAREAFESMREGYRVPLYVSAHTHNGEYIARGGEQGDEGWLELNVGSIVDWPIEFRTLSIHLIRDQQDKLLLRTKLFRIPDFWKDVPTLAPHCDPSWEAMPEDPHYYLSYTKIDSADPTETQKELIASILHTYKKYFAVVPSSRENTIWPARCSSNEAIQEEIDIALSQYPLKEKISLLIDLEDYDRHRTPEDLTAYQDYRLCQAVWASKYDKLERRQPIPRDSYIIFPRR